MGKRPKTAPARPGADAERGSSRRQRRQAQRDALKRRDRQLPRPRLRLTRQEGAAVLALGLLVAVSYFPAAGAGFVWDDNIFIVDSGPVQAADGLWRIWFSPGTTGEHHYWPLTYTTFWLEHKLWGFAPLGYHAVNLLLHLANTLLLWRLLLRLAVPGALLAAALFAAHPVHVEAVAWIIGRKDLLAALFYLAAARAWLDFTDASGPGRPRAWLPALGLFAAGLLCKSTVVTLPAALLLLQWWRQGRAGAGDLARLAPFFALGLAVVGADWAFYRSNWDGGIDYSFGERILLASRILWFYAARLFWPTGSPVFYPLWEVRLDDPLAWGCLAAAAAAAALLWRARARIGRGPLAGALFFAAALSPVLGFIDFSYMLFSFVGDRYQYLACAGLLAPAAAAAARAGERLAGAPLWALRGAACLVLALLGAATWRQTGIYRDEVTFFNHVISRNPQARSVHLGLSNALVRLGRMEEALAAARAAVERDPGAGGGYINAATALRNLGRPAEAEEYLRRFLARNSPDDSHNLLALANLVAGLLEEDRLDEAERHLRRLRAIEPQALIGIEQQARLRFRQGRYEESLGLFRTLVENSPASASAHSDLAVALFRTGRAAEALRSIDRALALDPDNAAARANRELVRAGMKSGRSGG